MANSADPARSDLQEHSDQGIHCLPVHLHLLTHFSMEIHFCLNFSVITANILGVRKLRTFMVIIEKAHSLNHKSVLI